MPLIEDSNLPAGIIKEFRNGEKFGSIRGITVILNDSSDVKNVYKLVNIKRKIK